MLTPKRSESTSLTVRLTPSSATDPFGRDKRHQRGGRRDDETHRLALRPSVEDSRDAIDMARHDMAAEFVADPQRAFEIDRGALAQSPRVEQESVSAEACTEKAPGSTATTVRHTPEQAIEAPSTIPAVS